MTLAGDTLPAVAAHLQHTTMDRSKLTKTRIRPGHRPLAGIMTLSLALFVLLPAGTRVQADEPADRGRQVVEHWCRLCHLRATDKPDPDMAPPFESIVQRAGHDRAWFVRFMGEDHFPMTTFRLFDHEKSDVIAYLLSLQRMSGQRR
jgi:cytochrome c5